MKLTASRRAKLIVFKICEYAEVGGMSPADCGMVYEKIADSLDSISAYEGDQTSVDGLLGQIQQILTAENWKPSESDT